MSDSYIKKLNKKRNKELNEVEHFYRTTVKKSGNGAKIGCLKKYLGYEVEVTIKKKTPEEK